MKKNNNGGFVLMGLLAGMTLISLLVFLFTSTYLGVDRNLHATEKRLQAKNYASEGLELVRGYFMTVQNQNRIGAWNNNIMPLNGYYVINIDNGYIIEPREEEIIEINEPFMVDYIRKIEIYNGDTVDEKRVRVEVDYGTKEIVAFETSLINLYGE